MMLERPPGGLRTFTEVLASWAELLSLRGSPIMGFLATVWLFLEGSGASQASEKLLAPPGAFLTLTEVVPWECLEKSISNC
jgi:hypothetical protein